MDVINTGMRKGIKMMCVVAQTAQFVSLMPKPEDFVTRVIGDVVYLSSQVQKLSENINKLLDNYADIPANYIMTQVNSITGSLSNITNRLNTYAQNGVNQIMGLGENVLNAVTDVTGAVIDTSSAVTGAIVNMGSSVVQAGSDIAFQPDFAQSVSDATEVTLEWINGGFETFKNTLTNPVNDAANEVEKAKNNLLNKVNDTSNQINDGIQTVQKSIETLIENIRDKMKKLSDIIDGGFKDVTGITSVSKGELKISEELKDYNDSKYGQAVSAASGAISTVLKNFSIGKVVGAFAGVLTQSIIVRTGLDQLPPLDVESMLNKIRNEITITPEELYEQYKALAKDTYEELKDMEKMKSENRNYTDEQYEEFKKEFEGRLQEERNNIRKLMKNSSKNRGDKRIINGDGQDVTEAFDAQSKKRLKSAIQEMQDYRKKVQKAKQADTLKSILGKELDNLRIEAQYRCNSIKADWESMMKQYKDSLSEIKEFFTTGGSCDMFIDDCCDDINQAFDDIKELCKGLTSQLIGTTVKIAMPADIGTVVPNPIYKIADFWLDIKTIFKFIKDLITLIIRIINDINKLARLMLNGLNNLKEIIQQLMNLLGLKWLMDLVQSIIDLFGDNIKNARERLLNTLSPIHFSDTTEYDNTIEALDSILEEATVNSENKTYLSDTVNLLQSINVNNEKINKLITDINKVKNYRSVNEDRAKKIEELIDALEEQGEAVVAYKSPIIEEVGSSPTVSDLTNGGSLDNDIKFVGWHFFHPNLKHKDASYYYTSIFKNLLMRFKSKIIKKASKNGHKAKGGVNQLRRKIVGRINKDIAYDAFYWYTYYTEDLEKDCFERKTIDKSVIIDNFVQTQNGSVVELTDGRKVFVAEGMIKSGDYVTVEGVKYRVK